MKLDREMLRLYLVTDKTWLRGRRLEEQVQESIESGATFIQLREKNMTYEAFVEQARVVKGVTDLYKIPFVINDSVEVAKEVDADGIHVGQGDMNARAVRMMLGQDKIIGVSARTVEQAIKAEVDGADYIGVGAVFTTATKLDASHVTYETLQDICRSVTIPVVAIGGVSEKNVGELKGSGIAGVAVVSAILSKESISKATKVLRRLVDTVVE